MAIKLPIEDLGEFIVQTFRNNADKFTTSLQTAEFGDYWNLPATAEKLRSKMPAFLVELTDSPLTPDPATRSLGGNYRFRCHYLFQLHETIKPERQALNAIAVGAGLFVVDDEMELPAWGEPVGAEMQFCYPSNLEPMNHSLAEMNIGWRTFVLECSVNSYQTDAG